MATMELAAFFILATITSAALLAYYKVSKHFGYFRDKPIPALPSNPLFGSSGPLFRKKCTFNDFVKACYDRFPNAKVIGMFDLSTRIFVLRDPELIKCITVKDFDHFVDRRSFFGDDEASESEHALLKKTLLLLTGERWRDMRAVLSPAFTGSKMRSMFELIETYCERMVDILKGEVGERGNGDYEMKDCFSRIATDVIATCAFGLQVESLKNRENEFYVNGRKMLNFKTIVTIVKLFGFMLYPRLMAKMGIDMIAREQNQYFSRIIKETVRTREERGIVRPDMIHLLMQARKGKLGYQHESEETSAGFATVEESNVGKSPISKSMSEAEFTAQCLIFFIAGYESISNVLTLMSYELAMNPEAQQKLFEEIVQTKEQLNGKPLSYDTLQKMKYMDMVVSEALRMWSAPATDRMCVKDYVIDDGEGLQLTIDKGTCVWIPIHGIHRDPKYYPNPDQFDPDRFSEENRARIDMRMYLPFGAGPRNCIGSRFALMEMKSILYHLVLNFRIERNDKTQVPVQLTKGFGSIAVEGGMQLRMTLRQ